ncbi:nucleolar protein 4-like isoform X2, partial [Biomphalaria pfeifferi]
SSLSETMTSAKRASPQPMEADTRVSESPVEEVVSRKNSPVPGKILEVSKGHPERKRRASSESGDSAMTKTSEGKDDDDDDDNDDDEKIPVGHDIDPERLKAFNMFVRLFVDENLDRMVPISKQPKDKIQAILEACDRQFPEFHERSRKRIRTYLKSCRRMRRSKEHNGWEPLRPTPPHLTSAAAESLLATACENESLNAKRMRLGLEPLPLYVLPPPFPSLLPHTFHLFAPMAHLSLTVLTESPLAHTCPFHFFLSLLIRSPLQLTPHQVTSPTYSSSVHLSNSLLIRSPLQLTPHQVTSPTHSSSGHLFNSLLIRSPLQLTPHQVTSSTHSSSGHLFNSLLIRSPLQLTPHQVTSSTYSSSGHLFNSLLIRSPLQLTPHQVTSPTHSSSGHLSNSLLIRSPLKLTPHQVTSPKKC